MWICVHRYIFSQIRMSMNLGVYMLYITCTQMTWEVLEKITEGRMGISASLSETEKNESQKRMVTRNRKIMGFGVRWP